MRSALFQSVRPRTASSPLTTQSKLRSSCTNSVKTSHHLPTISVKSTGFTVRPNNHRHHIRNNPNNNRNHYNVSHHNDVHLNAMMNDSTYYNICKYLAVNSITHTQRFFAVQPKAIPLKKQTDEQTKNQDNNEKSEEERYDKDGPPGSQRRPLFRVITKPLTPEEEAEARYNGRVAIERVILHVSAFFLFLGLILGIWQNTWQSTDGLIVYVEDSSRLGIPTKKVVYRFHLYGRSFEREQVNYNIPYLNQRVDYKVGETALIRFVPNNNMDSVLDPPTYNLSRPAGWFFRSIFGQTPWASTEIGKAERLEVEQKRREAYVIKTQVKTEEKRRASEEKIKAAEKAKLAASGAEKIEREK